MLEFAGKMKGKICRKLNEFKKKEIVVIKKIFSEELLIECCGIWRALISGWMKLFETNLVKSFVQFLLQNHFLYLKL